MKKVIMFMMCLFCIQSATFADNDRIIQFSQLPTNAQQMVNAQFKNKQVVYVNQDGILLKTFDVVFNDATKIEFDGKGQWKEVDMNTQAVPEFFIPASIQNYVKANYPGTIITCIDVERGLKRDQAVQRTRTKVQLPGPVD